MREIARLQGFPDTFVFHGPPTRWDSDVKGARPPAVARIIADLIGKTLERLQKREMCDTESHDSLVKRRKIA